MKIRYCILFVLAIIVSQTVLAQVKAFAAYEVSPEDTISTPGLRDLAFFQINDIKRRGIIVRLKTNKEKIAAYRREGYKKIADDLEQKTAITNMMLYYGFITRWSFGPLYFMESQHTASLAHDSLIAKTWDLQRDTFIHVDHDTLYIVDYGVVMDQAGPEEGTTPLAGSYLVIKDQDQKQLHYPIPFSAKVWGDRFTPTDNLQPFDPSQGLTDSINRYLNTYSTITDMLRSDGKNTIARYLNMVFLHASIESSSKAKGQDQIWGGPYTQAAMRFNDHFIEYYCKRLLKEKQIQGNENPIYWWQRNPNIRYLPYLRDLELRLKKSLDSKEKFISSH